MSDTTRMVDEILDLLDEVFDPWSQPYRPDAVTGDGPACQQPDPINQHSH